MGAAMNMMSEEERSKFLAALREDAEFRAAVQRELQMDALFVLPEEVVKLTRTVEIMNSGVNGLIDHEAEIQRGIAALTEQVTRLAEDQVQTRADVQNLVQMMGRLIVVSEENFGAMREGFQEMREGFQSLRTDMDNGFAAIDSKFDQVNAEIREIKGRLAS